jgi:hypothetical protein
LDKYPCEETAYISWDEIDESGERTEEHDRETYEKPTVARVISLGCVIS